MRLLLTLLTVWLFAACSSPAAKRAEVRPAHRFTPPVSPYLESERQIDFLRFHYWDNFDFADTVALRAADSVLMLRHFARFAAVCASAPRDRAPIDSLMRRAASSRLMLDYFAWMAEEVFHDPESPLRSDEHYIPVLEALLAAPYYNEYERMVPTFDLERARLNRLGAAANDFAFTSRAGHKGSLYGVKSPQTLLFFSNPDCAMCASLKAELEAAEPIARAVAEGRLRVVVCYVDEELDMWRAKREPMPKGWLDVADTEGRIRGEGLYDLRAIPSLYLLDEKKRVVVKDAITAFEIVPALL